MPVTTSLPGPPLSRGFFERDARDVAESLLGKLLVGADGRVARLVEVEAYLGMDDPGSHAFRGPTPRASIMFGPAARLYVYLSYGMHWCANVVCGQEGEAAAVLLRAAEPLLGAETMRRARCHGQRVPSDRDLCRGPGRLTKAFGITGEHNGLDLSVGSDGGEPARLWLADDGVGPGGKVVTTVRVGLSSSRGAELPLRFVVAGSSWASRGAQEGRRGALVGTALCT